MGPHRRWNPVRDRQKEARSKRHEVVVGVVVGVVFGLGHHSKVGGHVVRRIAVFVVNNKIESLLTTSDEGQSAVA